MGMAGGWYRRVGFRQRKTGGGLAAKNGEGIFQLRAPQVQPHQVGFSGGEFRFGLRHIHRAVGAASMEGFNEGEVFFAQFDGLGQRPAGPDQLTGS